MTIGLFSPEALARPPAPAGKEDPSARCQCGVALEGRWGQAYNEEAFHYFLAVERGRAERSHRPVLLLLVDLPGQGGVGAPMARGVARRLFAGLCGSLREMDVVGWYREQLVVGAILSEGRDPWRADVAGVVGERVMKALAARVPAEAASRLRIRIHRDPPSPHGDFWCLARRGAADPGRTRC
jgi:hypothetical protein